MPDRRDHRVRMAAIAAGLIFLPVASAGIMLWGSRMQGLRATVNVEEPVYTITSPNNCQVLTLS
jgi:hypothetical protein